MIMTFALLIVQVYMLFTFPNDSFVVAFVVNFTTQLWAAEGYSKETNSSFGITIAPLQTSSVFYEDVTEFISIMTPAQHVGLPGDTKDKNTTGYLIQYGTC